MLEVPQCHKSRNQSLVTTGFLRTRIKLFYRRAGQGNSAFEAILALEMAWPECITQHLIMSLFNSAELIAAGGAEPAQCVIVRKYYFNISELGGKVNVRKGSYFRLRFCAIEGDVTLYTVDLYASSVSQCNEK